MPRRRTQADETRAAASIAGLVVFNALIFHEILAATEARVPALLQIEREDDPVGTLVTTWELVEREIDYVPIFDVARRILVELTAGEVDGAVRNLCAGARTVVRRRAALRHDLMGRVYHRLLLDAKYLATYYTSVPAATLLAKLVFAPSRTAHAWHDVEAVRALRIADLACGTGTLLMASAEAVTDNHVRAAAEAGVPPALASLHQLLMEDVIHGYDVLATALHLTASTLALRASTTAFDQTNLHFMPLGGPNRALGSIEFIENREANAPQLLFREGVQIRGQQGEALTFAELPDLDFCLMNPPFARSVVGNLLFGSVPEGDREALQRRLQRVLGEQGAEASITAGLGAVFVAVAHPAIKPGGRLGLVLPKAVLSGVAWTPTRELLSREYQLDFVIASQDPRRWNFSENTSLSEALLVAEKNAEGVPERRDVTCVNFWRNPTTVFEALAAARSLADATPPSLDGQGAHAVMLGDEKIGEAFSVPTAALSAESWGTYAAFAQTDLIRVAALLAQGRVRIPGSQAIADVPTCRLDALGALGPDVRDIHDAFQRTEVVTQYRAHWGHNSNDVTTLAREPNTYLNARGVAAAGRNLRDANLIWSRAGRLMVTARLRLNTYRLAAVRLPTEALGSAWWPLALSEEIDERQEKALTLWLNSTLGLVNLLAIRVDTEGAWTQFKKPSLHAMPVLDPRALGDAVLDALAATFDEVAEAELSRFPAMHVDPVRRRVDTAIADALDLPPLDVVRELLAQEPVVCVLPLA